MNNLQQLVNRSKKYDNVDGTKELTMGIMVLGLLPILWLLERAPRSSIWHRSPLVFGTLNALFLLGLYFGVKAIKERVTYPRTGFVAYGFQRTVVRPAVLALVLGIPMMAALIVAARSHWGAAPGLVVGLLLAASYAIWIARPVPWKWAVVAAMTLGTLVIALLPAHVPAHFALALANFPPETARSPAEFIGALFLNEILFSALLVVSGGVSFWLYIRHTKAPVEE